MIDTDNKLLSPYTIARRINKSVQWVYRAIECGEIKAINISLGNKRSSWLIKQSDFQEFLKKKGIIE